MFRRAILIATIMGGAASAVAQVDNYALSLTADAKVDCGTMDAIDALTSFTVQLWMCPDQWTPNAVVAGRGSSLSLSLGQAEGSLNFAVGDKTLAISSDAIKCGSWAQVTVVCDQGSATALVNGVDAGSASLGAIPAVKDTFVIGAGYAGRVDELRVWNIALPNTFNRFINNTLNTFNPLWSNLVAYYKMDQELCDALVDYTYIDKPDAEFNNHGLMSQGAEKVRVTDNPGLPYLINGAYTANERFYDRAIPREQYLLSNDLIILGVEFVKDSNGNLNGHVQTVTPNNHATASGGVSYLAECDGRMGVAAFDGTGVLIAPERTLSPYIENDVAKFTFETWLYVDEWVKDAYIFRKESDDASQGFSLRLGEEGQLYVRCNGNDYGAKLNLETKKWYHIGIIPNNGGYARNTFLFAIEGSGKAATTSLCTGGTDANPSGLSNLKAKLGENFKGKLDETLIWGYTFDALGTKNHSNNVPMPGLSIKQTSYLMQKANTCYLYDDPEDLGYSSYSQDNWRDIMMAAYEGYRGVSVRISVKSANGWQNCIASAEKRKNFAMDLAEIAKGYDGVELDLEWMDGTQTNLGLLAKEIRTYLPEGKTFFVSCHAYGAYLFPKDDMQYVDGFTFQQYGPQETFFTWSNFTSSTSAFLNYGFEPGKVMTSYATTTSNGYDANGNKKDILGVKDGFFTIDGFKPSDNSGTLNGYTFTYTGPEQTYKRAAYTLEKGLQGIFYWDMGNDLPVSDEYNLAKWCSYGLNANVDKLVTSVEVKHQVSSLTNVAAELNTNEVTVNTDGHVAAVKGLSYDNADVKVYSAVGKCLSAQPVLSGLFSVGALTPGVYVAVFSVDGTDVATAKFIKK